MYAAIRIARRDDVATGAILNGRNWCVHARRNPAGRAEVVPQDQIHDVGLAVEQVVEARAEDDAHIPVPGCTAHGAVTRARRHMAGLRHCAARRWRALAGVFHDLCRTLRAAVPAAGDDRWALM